MKNVGCLLLIGSVLLIVLMFDRGYISMFSRIPKYFATLVIILVLFQSIYAGTETHKSFNEYFMSSV